MDHTAINLQRTPHLPLPRKRALNGASTECGGGHLIAAENKLGPFARHSVVSLEAISKVTLVSWVV